MRTLLVRAFVPLLVAALLLAGVITLGEVARDALRQQDRYVVAFADIDCEPPPGQERTAFLNEVQYVGELPERLQLLDDDLAVRLARAFARHPRVEKVLRVEIVPPRQVRVLLVYRPQPPGSSKEASRRDAGPP